MENAMKINEIELIQKENASRELEGWLDIVAIELCTSPLPDNVDKITRALFILSQATKALRRYGHFRGLDKEAT